MTQFSNPSLVRKWRPATPHRHTGEKPAPYSIRGRYPVPGPWIPVYVEAMGRPHFHTLMWPSQGHGDSGLEPDSASRNCPHPVPGGCIQTGWLWASQALFQPLYGGITANWHHVGIASGNGIMVMLMVYVLGPVSGAHINPAVIFGMAHRGRLPRRSRRDRGLGPRRPVWQANRPCTRDTRRDPKQG